MKTFVLIFHGHESPNGHLAEAWDRWLRRRAGSLIDRGASFGPGRRITNDTTTEFTLETNPASGYSFVRAPHLDAAEQLLDGCPIADSVTLYEVHPTRPSPTSRQPGNPGTMNTNRNGTPR